MCQDLLQEAHVENYGVMFSVVAVGGLVLEIFFLSTSKRGSQSIDTQTGVPQRLEHNQVAHFEGYRARGVLAHVLMDVI